MKVKATTPEMVVVDPETDELISFFNGKRFRVGRIQVIRTYKDRFEIDLNLLDSHGSTSKKTLKMHFDDLILMDATMHQICTSFKEGKKAEKETTSNP